MAKTASFLAVVAIALFTIVEGRLTDLDEDFNFPENSLGNSNGGGYCAGKKTGHYPDPNNCHGYISCVHGRAYIRKCPAKLVWSDSVKRCEWPHLAKPPCHHKPSYCKGKKNGHYPDPKNCHGYISCVHGITYRRKCPARLVWSDSVKRCEWPHLAKPPCKHNPGCRDRLSRYSCRRIKYFKACPSLGKRWCCKTCKKY